MTVEGGSGNVVSRNIVLGSLRDGIRDGIRVDTFAPDDLPTTDTVIRGNIVRGAGVDGISVGTETTNPVINTRIEHNRVSRSTDDGIDVLRVGTILLGNLANHNGDLGISAMPGTIDAGGNRAHGNGNPAQCVGVRVRLNRIDPPVRDLQLIRALTSSPDGCASDHEERSGCDPASLLPAR